jgi:glycosyltransferase involved in cell wall biosynthesis
MRIAKEETNDGAAPFPKVPAAGSFRKSVHEAAAASAEATDVSAGSLRVAVLTGGGDKPYAHGLAACLISQGVHFDFVGSNELDEPELHQNSLMRFLNLRGDMRSDVATVQKVLRVLTYYWRLLRYAATSSPKVFHILWNNKLEFLDRTLVLLYYRFLGKRIAFTVHNVNAGWRDSSDTFFNRLTLRIQYKLCDHLFVHTEQMRQELRTHFGVADKKISVIPFGINSSVPNTALTSVEARKRLGLSGRQKVVLFFGNIAPYKGLEYLIEAVALLVHKEPNYRLVIAGRPKKGESYWEQIRRRISSLGLSSHVIERIEYVPDADTEVYFKAADLLVLPYTHIFQSGVLFLGYNFGLPVVASDVGSLKEEIIEGKTGFVCRPRDPVDLSKSIETYFSGELYRRLETCRPEIQNFAAAKYSWTKVGEITRAVYVSLLV